MVENPYELGRFVYLPGKRIYGLYFEIPPSIIEEHAFLYDLFKYFADANIPVLHFKMSRPVPGKNIKGIMFLDFTDKRSNIKDVEQVIKKKDYIKDARIITPLVEGLVVDNVMFPPVLHGERVFILREPGLRTFVKSLREKTGTGYEAILYHIGYAMGKEYFKSHLKIVGDDLEELTAFSEAMFAIVGLGILEYKRIDFSEKYAETIVRQSLECSFFKKSSKPMGHFTRGLLSGWFSELFRIGINSKEVSCISMGDAYCKFIFEKSHT